MSDGRMSRAKKNIAASLLNQIITLACGLIVPRTLLGAFGSETYGACSSIKQFLSYIALLEGGVGGVARAVLYKPLADHDTEAIGGVLAEIRRFFRGIILAFAVYVLILACSFQKISHVESLDWLTTFFLVIVISLSTFAQYSIGLCNSILLQAAQKSYIIAAVNVLATVLNAVFVVLLVAGRRSILEVKLVSSLIYIVKPIVLWGYVQKNYHPAKGSKRSKIYLTQKWSGLGQHIAYFVHSNTDVVILTCFANLKAVAIYSVYNMVIANMQNLATAFTSGMEALFGDMLAKEENEKLRQTFETYETIISVVSVILFSVTEVLIAAFVKIYTSEISDADYEAPLFAFILILSAVLYCLRMPYHSVVIAAGHFRQTGLAAYGEACINVGLSILLVSKMGLVGVAIGTAAATLFRMLYYVGYLSKHCLNRSTALFAKRFLVNAAAFAAACVSGSLIVSRISIDGYAVWAMCGVGVAFLSAAVVLGINALFYRETCAALFNAGINQFKNKRSKR